MHTFQRHTVVLAIALILFMTTTVPWLFRWVNRADIWLLGLPLSLFWIVLVTGAIGLLLLIMWRVDAAKEKE